MAKETTQGPSPTPSSDNSGGGVEGGGGGGGGGGKKGSPCEECGEQPWKYRCPGCGRLTCSLPCVQAHKRRTACTGKRPRADPVPIAQFDDRQLLSDYNLLEETKQVKESAHRLISSFGGNFTNYLPNWLHLLRKAANRKGIRLFFLPRGMTKREQNRSRYDRRKNCIYWTLQWRFNSTDVVLIDHGIDEQTSLFSLLEKHLSPNPWKDQLTPYRNAELLDLKLFIQKSAKVAKSPYRQLCVQKPLGPQLRGILLLEHPVIHVFLPTDSYDFEVEKTVNKLGRNDRTSGTSADNPMTEAIQFKEEEIEEGEMASETQVIDLKDYGIQQPRNHFHAESTSKNDSSVFSCVATRVSGNDTKNDSSVFSCAATQAPGNNTQGKEINQQIEPVMNATPEACMKVHALNRVMLSSAEVNMRRFSEDGSLDFEQEVKDAYCEQLGEMNPDDFLCFDFEVTNEDELMEMSRQLELVEDLEEGEIPGC